MLSGTKTHRDHTSDQAGDHKTKGARPRLFGLAEAVLAAIADGSAESLPLATELVEQLLMQEDVLRALHLQRLLADRSPFALVRAVELAEHLLFKAEDRAKGCR